MARTTALAVAAMAVLSAHAQPANPPARTYDTTALFPLAEDREWSWSDGTRTVVQGPWIGIEQYALAHLDPSGDVPGEWFYLRCAADGGLEEVRGYSLFEEGTAIPFLPVEMERRRRYRQRWRVVGTRTWERGRRTVVHLGTRVMDSAEGEVVVHRVEVRSVIRSRDFHLTGYWFPDAGFPPPPNRWKPVRRRERRIDTLLLVEGVGPVKWSRRATRRARRAWAEVQVSRRVGFDRKLVSVR